LTSALILYLLIMHVKIFRMSYNKLSDNLGKFKE
jgi:hypothetical protein